MRPARHLSATLAAMVALAMALALGRAQELDDPDAPADGIGASKRALIVRYIEATNVLSYYDQVVSEVLAKYAKNFPQVEGKFWEEFKAYHIEPTDLYRRLIPVYAKHFTETDLRASLAFFESPAGRKYTAVLPMLGRETGAAVRAFEEKFNKDIVQQLRNSGY